MQSTTCSSYLILIISPLTKNHLVVGTIIVSHINSDAPCLCLFSFGAVWSLENFAIGNCFIRVAQFDVINSFASFFKWGWWLFFLTGKPCIRLIETIKGTTKVQKPVSTLIVWPNEWRMGLHFWSFVKSVSISFWFCALHRFQKSREREVKGFALYRIVLF